MKVLTLVTSVLVLFLWVFPAQPRVQTPTRDGSKLGEKPIVAIVQRTKWKLSIIVHPDPLPGKDPLRIFNALHDKFGSGYPVVAVVDDAKISDLYAVSGTAGKAGFENIRTFISHYDNGKMFEVRFGTALPFSVNGPFETESDNSPK